VGGNAHRSGKKDYTGVLYIPTRRDEITWR